ncbi:MAG: MraY family glycosyltransferase [Planctomycetota bacterium]
MTIALISFVAALIMTLLLMPGFMKLAPRIGLVDAPDDNRKLHKKPIPMVGGISIFFAIAITSAACLYFGSDHLRFRTFDVQEMLGLLAGSLILLLVGVVDDRFAIRGRQKLIGQIIAVTVLIASGFSFDRLVFAGMEIELGIASWLAVYAWMLVAVNSVNLLDGADGFASTVGVIMAGSLGVMALLDGKIVDAVVILALAGGLIGFLRFNFPPAKAFLGDAGSMLIGFLLGALAIRCMFKQAALYAFFAPIALLAIPLIDTSAAIIRRRLTGRSIYTVDRGHLHHRLAKHGYSPRLSLLWVAALCTVTAAGGVMAMYFRQSEYAVVSIIVVFIVMIAGKIFGLSEFQLVSTRVAGFAKSFVGVKEKGKHVQHRVHVQGVHDWEALWDEVCDFADEHELNEVTIDLNLPWMHESFHATRRKAGTKKDRNHEWYAEVPLLVGNRIFGRIEVLNAKNGKFTHYQVLSDLLKILPDLEQLLIESEASSVDMGRDEIAAMEAKERAVDQNDEAEADGAVSTGQSDDSHSGDQSASDSMAIN